MAITVADNFSYQGKKPLDGRDTFATLAAMKAYAEASVYDGCLSYCDEDGKRYEFKSTNTVDPTTGKWREFETGGGGQTYNDFTGATSSTAGAHGLVPAPSAGDEGKVLFGNGSWGALPSVDLSVLSNEANILSTTEKAIGQHTDGKILYQKVVDCGSMPAYAVKTVAHGISNLGEVVLLRGITKYDNGSGYTSYPLPKIHDQDINLDIGLAIDSTNISLMGRGNGFPGYTGFVILRYTKTTDSPLPSGVKYAGVTASGEVILEKTVTGVNFNIDPNAWRSTSMSNSGIGKLVGIKAGSSSGAIWSAIGATGDDGNYIKIHNARVDAINIAWFTVQYVPAS